MISRRGCLQWMLGAVAGIAGAAVAAVPKYKVMKFTHGIVPSTVLAPSNIHSYWLMQYGNFEQFLSYLENKWYVLVHLGDGRYEAKHFEQLRKNDDHLLVNSDGTLSGEGLLWRPTSDATKGVRDENTFVCVIPAGPLPKFVSVRYTQEFLEYRDKHRDKLAEPKCIYITAGTRFQADVMLQPVDIQTNDA